MEHATRWDPRAYAKNARFVSDLGEPLLHLLEPCRGERILDLGCGDGALTEKLSAEGALVCGVDSSFAQAQAARSRGFPVCVMDGHELAFRPSFDAVFTNAALHWMKRPREVISAVARALKAGGRFVGEFGGQGNVEQIRRALHRALQRRGVDPYPIDPWFYPSPGEYSELLGDGGFNVTYIELIPRPTLLPGDILDWLDVFAQPFTNALGAAERHAYIEEVCAMLAPALCKSDGRWFADYVRLRFRAER